LGDTSIHWLAEAIDTLRRKSKQSQSAIVPARQMYYQHFVQCLLLSRQSNWLALREPMKDTIERG
jgi:hypothetical protein